MITNKNNSVYRVTLVTKHSQPSKEFEAGCLHTTANGIGFILNSFYTQKELAQLLTEYIKYTQSEDIQNKEKENENILNVEYTETGAINKDGQKLFVVSIFASYDIIQSLKF